jgi:hypothetical protein
MHSGQNLATIVHTFVNVKGEQWNEDPEEFSDTPAERPFG